MQAAVEDVHPPYQYMTTQQKSKIRMNQKCEKNHSSRTLHTFGMRLMILILCFFLAYSRAKDF